MNKILKKVSLLLVFYCVPAISFCQQNNFQSILDSGKAEFKAQFIESLPDYAKAYSLLKQAVALQPDHAEARYFLGYLLDKINMLHGMDSVELGLALDVSEQLETVNKQQPYYNGELMLLDPYSKLTANWASLAFSYLGKKKSDSALWALTEGKKRGAFNNAILNYNRQILQSCEKNSILIVTGDNVSFPCLYLQKIEKFREDVIIIDANLLNENWYSKVLKRQENLELGFKDAELDTLDYIEWEPSTIKIADKTVNKEPLEWELKPIYMGALLIADRILLNVIKNYFFKKDIYFIAYLDSTNNLFLYNHLRPEGLVDKLVSANIDTKTKYYFSQNAKNYSLDGLSKEEITKSKDVVMAFNGLRLYYLNSCNILAGQNKIKEAQDLFAEMEKRLPQNKLPFFDEQYEKYYISIKDFIK